MISYLFTQFHTRQLVKSLLQTFIRVVLIAGCYISDVRYFIQVVLFLDINSGRCLSSLIFKTPIEVLQFKKGMQQKKKKKISAVQFVFVICV